MGETPIQRVLMCVLAGSIVLVVAATPASETEVKQPDNASSANTSVRILVFETEVFHIEFDTRGARPCRWDIIAPEFLSSIPSDGESSAIRMIPRHVEKGADRDLPLEVSFRELGRRSYPRLNRLNYDCTLTNDTEGNIVVRCVSPTVAGLQIVKKYRFAKDSFLVDLSIDLINKDDWPRQITSDEGGLGLVWGPGIGERSPAKSFTIPPWRRYTGTVAVAVLGRHMWESDVNNITPPCTGEVLVDRHSKARWAGMVNGESMVAIIPSSPQSAISTVVTLHRQRNILAGKQSQAYTLIAFSEPVTVPGNGTVTYDYKIFVGPMKRSVLASTGYGLKDILPNRFDSLLLPPTCLVLFGLCGCFAIFFCYMAKRSALRKPHATDALSHRSAVWALAIGDVMLRRGICPRIMALVALCIALIVLAVYDASGRMMMYRDVVRITLVFICLSFLTRWLVIPGLITSLLGFVALGTFLPAVFRDGAWGAVIVLFVAFAGLLFAFLCGLSVLRKGLVYALLCGLGILRKYKAVGSDDVTEPSKE